VKGIEAVEGVWGEATGDGAIGPEVQVLRLEHRLRDLRSRIVLGKFLREGLRRPGGWGV